MADDSIDQYFAKRFANAPEAPKPEQLINSLREKAQVLNETAAHRKQVLADRAVDNKISIVGLMGFDPEGAAGTVTNLAAQGLTGAVGVVGSVLAGGQDLVANLQDDVADEGDLAAYARYTQNKATPEDMARLGARAYPKQTSKATKLEMLQTSDQVRSNAKATRDLFDISAMVHKDNTEEFREDLGMGFDEQWNKVIAGKDAFKDKNYSEAAKSAASGLAGLIVNAGKAAGDNPKAVAEYVAQNLPQVAIGAARGGQAMLSGTNTAYALENYEKGLAAYREKNNGAFPPEEERLRMAGLAASLALAEHVGDVTVLKGMLPKKAVKDTIEGVAESIAKDGVKSTLEKMAGTTVDAIKKSVVNPITKSVVTEGATEGYQTAVENELVGEELSAKAIYEGAVIGGLVGGGMTTPGTVASAVASTVKAAGDVKAKVKNKEPAASETKEVLEAIKTGDVSKLLDEKNRTTYAPDRAIAALFGNSQLETTTPEAKQANLTKAGEIITQLQEKKAAVETDFNRSSPEEVKRQLDTLESIKGELDQKEYVEMKREVLSLPKLRKSMEANLSSVTRQLNEAIKNEGELRKLVSPAEDIDTVIEEVKAPESTPEVGEKLVTLAMMDTSNLTDETATQLANDTSNKLTTPQRDFLRAFSEARKAENAAKSLNQVNKEILFGSTKNKGIKQYRETLNAAIASGDEKSAAREVAGLEKFAATQESKAVAADLATAIGGNKQIVRNEQGLWITPTQPLPEKELKAKGGMVINSPGLLTSFNVEAKALNTAKAELQAAYAVKFGKTVPTKESNVQDPAVQQARTGNGTSQTQAQGAQEASPVASVSEGTTRVSDAGTPGVETARVNPDSVPASELAETVEAEASVVESADSATKVEESPSLNTLQKKSPEGVGFKKRNLIADFFTQVSSRAGDATQRPLVAVKNFLSQTEKKVTDFLQVDELTDEQTQAIHAFRTLAAKWAPKLKENLKAKSNKDFSYEDPLQFFIEETANGLDLEENVKTAMSYAAFSTIVEKASQPDFNTPKDINNILGRNEEARVSDFEYDKLGHVGVRQSVVANAIGSRVVQALGLKALKTADKNLQPRLEAALGTFVMKMLLDEGILVRNTVSAADMALLTGKESNSGYVDHHFVKLNRKDGQLKLDAETAVKGIKGSQSVLDKLFSVESGRKEPSFAPIPFTQKTTKNTKQGIPSFLGKIIAKMQSEGNYLRQDMWQLMSKLDDETVAEMAGAEDTASSHISALMSKKAKKDGLMREWLNAKDFFSSMKDHSDPMYFEHFVWKQQRVGIATNLINPQTSKIHRHMLYKQSWETKVDISNAAQMDNFRLRVAEGLGIKTDKQGNASSLEAYKAKVQDPKIKAAVAAIRKTVLGASPEAMTPAYEQAILEGVKAGGEKMHSLDALMALATYAEAVATNQPSFTTALMGEVDGVTNGPMLSHVLMGAASSLDDLYKMANRGGFYRVGSAIKPAIKNFNIWKSNAANKDLYQTTTANVYANLDIMKRAPKEDRNYINQKQLNAVFTITGQLYNPETDEVSKDGRNIIKTPITALVYGSAVSSAVKGMADGFIDNIYTRIEQLNAPNPKVSKTDLIKALNALGVNWDLNMSEEDMLNTPFTDEQIKRLLNGFTFTLGKAVTRTLNEDFGDFLTRVKTITKATSLTFSLYNGVYQGIRAAKIKALEEAGEFEIDAKGNPIRDLNAAQEAEVFKEVQKAAPLLHTAMSKVSNELGNSLYSAKTDKKLSSKASYKGSMSFAKKFKDSDAKSAIFNAQESVEEAPGVSMVSQSVHSLDSFISHFAANNGEVLNIHDAHGSGLANFEQTARNLNEATWQALLTYSPMEEVHASLSRTLQEVAALVQAGSLPPGALVSLKNELAGLAKKSAVMGEVPTLDELVRGTVIDSKLAANAADKTKYEFLSQLGHIDQYALEGGQYDVTESDRAEAKAKLAGLDPAVSEQDMAAVDAIMDALDAVAGEGSESSLDAEMVAAMREASELEIPTPQAFQILEYLEKDQDNGLTPDERAAVGRALDVMRNDNSDVNTALSSVATPQDAATITSRIFSLSKIIHKETWGERGASVIEHNSELEALLSNNNVVSPKEVISLLYKQLKSGPQNNITEFNIKLLQVLNKLVKNDLKIRYVTPSTHPSLVKSVPPGKVFGWYSQDKDGAEIYIRSADYKVSGVTTELLIHELIHSVLVDVVDGNTAPEVKELVDELNELFTKAQEYMAANNLSQYSRAVTNVHELISWGMTNVGFQRDVLSKISMQSKTQKNTLITGLQSFIKTITGIIFRNSSKSEAEKQNNGLAVLIGNVSGLFAAASQTQSRVTATLAQSALDQVNTYSTVDIYSALQAGNLDPEFDTHLRGILANIVQKMYGPYGSFREDMMNDQAITPQDVFKKALDTGVAPFASESLAAGFKVSAQEAFVLEQVEATVNAGIQGNEGRTYAVTTELDKLYRETRARLTPADFLALAPNQQEADALYNFIFKMEKNRGSHSDYLSRFAAMGLTHQGFNQLLQVATSRSKPAPKTFSERLTNIFQTILEFFSGKLTNTYAGQPADAKLLALVGQLVDIEAKKKRVLAKRMDADSPIEEAFTNASENLKKKVSDFIDNSGIRNSKNGFIAGVGGVVSVLANDRVDQVLEGLNQFRDQHFNKKQGILAGMLRELRSMPEMLQGLLRITKDNEKHRKFIITQVGKSIMDSFTNKGEDLTDADKSSLSAVFLRTGAHTLLDTFNMSQLATMLKTPSVLAQEIQNIESQLKAFGSAEHFFLKQAKSLAYARVTGHYKADMVLMNAWNIANMYGTPYAGRLSEAKVKAAEPLINTLVSLYGLKYSESADRSRALRTLEAENARIDGGNGVEMALKLHKALEKQSEEKLFKDSKALMMKGYTPEILNPHTDFVIANDVQGKELINMGYIKGREVPLDPADPSSEVLSMYVLRDGGLQPRQTGIISYTGMASKGNKLHDKNMDPSTVMGRHNANTQSYLDAQKYQAIRDMFKPDPTFDPSKVKQNFMVPVLNPRGEVVNWRYMASEATKESVLEKDNRLDRVLGVMAGSIYDKESTQVQNTKTIRALKDMYNEEFAQRSYSYQEISPTSPDPELREIWRLLPEGTKQEIREIWGGDRMMVRVDVLDMVFGYKKHSLADAITKSETDRNIAEQAFAVTAEWLVANYAKAVNTQRAIQGKPGLGNPDDYAKRTAVFVRRAERAWQEIIREMKDIIVVKSGVVMAGNIWSNMTLLGLHGVPLKDMATHHAVALKGATAYQKDSRELFRLKQQLEMGYTTSPIPEIQREIIRLENALANNPVKELIDAGLMPTIVEDVNGEEDKYSYKSQFARKTSAFTDKLNPKVLEAAKMVYMTHDTKAYQTLSQITQLSDFVARYTLYQHLISRKKNPLSKEAAIQEASDAFVNYDIPMHRLMQYTDDMGITMFTKYFMRIQKVIFKLGREHPARVLGLLVLNNFVDMGSTVLDSSMFNRIGNNPIQPGILQFPGVIDELATVQAGLSLLK